MLPKSKIPTERVELSGGYVDIRGLTVAEYNAVGKLDGSAQNILAISYATGEEHDAVKSWYNAETTLAGDVDILCRAIMRLSATDGAAQFPARTSDDVVDPRTGT